MNSNVTSSFARRRAVMKHFPLLATLASLTLAGPAAGRDGRVFYNARLLPFSLDPGKPHRGRGSVQLPAALASSAPKGKMPIP